jgi:hypothetical protein
MPRWGALAAFLGILAILSSGCARRTFADRVESPKWDGFSERVKTYTDLVEHAQKNVSPLPDRATPEQISIYKRALGDRIRDSRRGAQPGDIFGPDREKFLHVVRTEVRGAAGRPTKSTIAEDDPSRGETGPPVRLAINARWPDGAPLSTVPPTLLFRLPTLPEGLEYRFVGKALVLHDARAHIIVDYIPNALT